MSTVQEAIKKASDIVNGHIKQLFNENDELSESRLDICKTCPIFKPETPWGPMCDKMKYIDKEDNVSDTFKTGYTRGCGCNLRAKTRLPNNHCVVDKW